MTNVPSQSSLVIRPRNDSSVAPADVSMSGLVEGAELWLAVHGSHKQIRYYLDEQRRRHGREVELHSADVIAAEKGHRRVATLASQGRLLNGSNPGGAGRLDELVGVLATMAADISEIGDPSDGEPMLVQRDRRLVSYDQSQTPAAVEITTPSQARIFFLQSLVSMHGSDPWPYFYRNADLRYVSLVPKALPRIDRGFSLTPDGQVFHRGKPATQAQVREYWAPRDPPPGVTTRVPDADPISDLEHFTEQSFDAFLRGRRFPGVDDISVLTRDQEDTLAQRLAALADSAAPQLWRGSKSSLAAALQWGGSVPALNAELRKAIGGLAALGWCLAKAGRGGQTRAQEFMLVPLRRTPENLAGEISK